ncbi:hypothetical protein BGZ47_005372 [Haplosporangium gracile]|nr:hypothetical protein BGZ47_005372 [Haplosporangium gracile]
MGKKITTGTLLHSGTIAESRIIQRKVYAQLDALASLQQLTLGNWLDSRNFIVDDAGEQGPVFYNPLFQTNCLEMSLESGLGLLGGLMALQLLDVSSMAHRIGKDGLRWMESRWHSMRELVGLDRMEVDAIWLKINLGYVTDDWKLHIDTSVAQRPVYRDPLFHPNSLEMTIESGLCSLGGPKNLRILNAYNMALSIGPKETWWADAAWSNLVRLQGVVRTLIVTGGGNLAGVFAATHVPSGAIPELVHEIANYLVLHDLTQLVRVSKEWRQAWTPHLWRDVKVLTTQQQSSFMEPTAQEALFRNRGLVRLFWYRVSSSANPLAALGNTYMQQPLHLTDLCFQAEIDDPEDQKPLFKLLIIVLKQSPFLSVLDIPNSPPAGIVVETLLKCIAQSLPYLRRLTLFTEDEPYVRPYVVKEFLDTVSAELEYLSMGIEFCHGDRTDSTVCLSQPVQKCHPHPKLKCVGIYMDFSGDKDKTIVPWVLSGFLRGCTNLDVVEGRMHLSATGACWIWNYPSVMEIVESVLGIRLRHLHVRKAATPRSDKDISTEITSIASGTSTGNGTFTSSSLSQEAWHTICIDKCPLSMTLTNGAILSAATSQPHGPYVISVDNIESMKSSDVQAVLHQDQSLRCLSSRLPPTILVTEMISSPPWSCRFITTLKIQISGIPRPDIYTDYRNRLAPTLLGVSMKQSRAIQRQVYSQLGQLTLLQILCLGADSPATELEVSTDIHGTPVFFDRRLQLRCLELTLESGLDLLAGLRGLEWLTVENMDHRIGFAELLWMEKSWPNIKRVKGLVRCRNGSEFRSGRMVPTGSVIAPGRACGSKVEVLDCNVSFCIT